MSGLLTRQPDDCSGCHWKYRFAEPVAPQDIDTVLNTCQSMLMRQQGHWKYCSAEPVTSHSIDTLLNNCLHMLVRQQGQCFDRDFNLQRGCALGKMTKGGPDTDWRLLSRRSAYPCHAVHAVSFAASQADHMQYRVTQHCCALHVPGCIVHVTLENSAKKTAREKWYMVFMVCRSRVAKKMEAPLAARGRYTSLCSDKLFCTTSKTASEHQSYGF